MPPTFALAAGRLGQQKQRRRHRLGRAKLEDMDHATVVVGATSTLVAVFFLLALGAFLALGHLLHRNPQCLGHYHHHANAINNRGGGGSIISSTNQHAGWAPIELAREEA